VVNVAQILERMNFISWLILTAQYQTSDPGHLPEVAQRLAAHPDDGYSVHIATYESRWNSFLR
jgi:hypothetical protein